jgi:hypothetical protein
MYRNVLLLVGAIIVLPLAGAALAGREIGRYFMFPPPLAIPLDYTRFSWAAVWAVGSALAVVVASWAAGAQRVSGNVRQRMVQRALPAWGSWAMGWTALWWLLAWTRFEWFAPVQRFTFFPLWLGFIVTLNAIAYWRSGSCLMLRNPGGWTMLFAASAAFWWIFEWLNRFVRNWHYLGVQDFGAVAYAVHATLCFSTVLPAVAGMAEVLRTFPRWREWTTNGPRWRWISRRSTAWAFVGGSLVALFLTGMRPQWFYPALWVAPLALWLGMQELSGTAKLTREISHGDWARAATWMMGALICGGFWEMWNWHSAAKWIYTVPGVERWHIFEMPLLGYAGYLPFGLECLLVAELVLGSDRAVAKLP